MDPGESEEDRFRSGRAAVVNGPGLIGALRGWCPDGDLRLCAEGGTPDV